MNHQNSTHEPQRTTIQFKRLSPDAKLPTKAYDTDAGIDFYTAEEVILEPHEPVTISTGIAAVIPDGYCLVMHDRSSMGAKGIRVLAGVIDSGYRGEIKITLIDLNHTTNGSDIIRTEPSDSHSLCPSKTIYGLKLEKGTKIAQALLLPVPTITIQELQGDLPNSPRGTKGYGSSGT